MTDFIICRNCGTEEHAHLIDAKPEIGADENSDFTRMECIACYGPGWRPAASTSDFKLSVAPHLAPYYAAYAGRMGWTPQ
ncbi:hypothetical protein [Bradyrhizobium sp. C9]|uniref:hypothetical protein n=1 Tax=Bradyrhizobium sp. C9 TaxID=142585 RepID=UPI000BE82812|nr:hypothetical protein [Bradyrhizobium sp. C9]PDT77200.1 hypothetical protein CO675_11725 [Bradyrhizobium sp. C9]